MNTSGIEKAIAYAGSASALARRIGVTYKAVTKWRDTRVPLERCKQVEKATDGRVTRFDLRPDFFDDMIMKDAA